MATFEEQLDSLLERAKSIVPPNKLKTAAEKQPADKWMNDVQIFYNERPRIRSAHRFKTVSSLNRCFRGIGFLFRKYSGR